MADRPILFSGPLVRAILAGRKTVTRRVIRLGRHRVPSDPSGYSYNGAALVRRDAFGLSVFPLPACPFGEPGDRLWVRETWADVNTENGPAVLFRADNHYRFCCDDAYPVEYDRYPGCQFTMWCGDLLRGEPDHKWRPSIHMPRFASRITLEVTDVRAERLQAITEEDAKAEGASPEAIDMACECQSFEIEFPGAHTAKCPWRNPSFGPDELEPHQLGFAHLWSLINGPRPGCSWEENCWVWRIAFRRVDAEAEVANG